MVNPRLRRTTFTTFANNLRRIRAERGWTQEQLGDRVGLSKTVISRWEACHVEPLASSVVLVARGLGISTDALLIDQGADR